MVAQFEPGRPPQHLPSRLAGVAEEGRRQHHHGAFGAPVPERDAAVAECHIPAIALGEPKQR